MSKLRAIFLGLGRAGQGHLKSALDHGVEAVAVFDPNLDTLDAPPSLEHEGKRPRLARSADEAFAVPADIAFISSPNSVHVEQATRAIANNLHIWLEKPIALTLREAGKLVTEIDQKPHLKTFVPLSGLINPPLREAQRIFHSGRLGELIQVFATLFGGTGFRGSGSSGHYACNQPELTGGWVFHHCCHALDFLTRIGGSVRWISGVSETTIPNALPNQEEAITAMMTFKNGGLGCLMDNISMCKYHQYGIIGAQGSYFVNIINQKNNDYWAIDTTLQVQADGHETFERKLFTDRDAYLKQRDAFGIQAFIEAIREDKPSPYHFREGLENIKLCVALQKSTETNQNEDNHPPVIEPRET